ncbi:MAG: radical SAM protein [Clostridiales bacterium]|nr:radical SAM protein [Clostridiales bacterium]
MHYAEAKGILSSKNGMNLYRGCTHGCIYCDSRSGCYHMNHDFEDVEIKKNAAELLEKELKSKRRPCMIGMGSMTDPYMPLEENEKNTRKALELIYKYGFGAALITKSDLVLRDLDILGEINKQSKAVVQITVTTFDDELCKKIEPGVCPASRRFRVLKKLRDAGIPTVVWLCPILPFINDTKDNISDILDGCIEARVYGIICFGMGLTLRQGSREYFYAGLDRLFPGLKEKYIKTYGNRYEILSPRNKQLMDFFHNICKIHSIVHDNNEIFEYLRTYDDKTGEKQLSLFD